MIFKEVFMDIIAMRRNGYSIRKIAKIEGIHRKTVKKYPESHFVLSMNWMISTGSCWAQK